MERPFTKSTNDRGNDVYQGVIRNSSTPEGRGIATLIELASSHAQAKQLYDQMVAQKLKEGFTPRPDLVAASKAEDPDRTELWVGRQVFGQTFSVEYRYNSHVSSWLFTIQAGYYTGK